VSSNGKSLEIQALYWKNHGYGGFWRVEHGKWAAAQSFIIDFISQSNQIRKTHHPRALKRASFATDFSVTKQRVEVVEEKHVQFRAETSRRTVGGKHQPT
jgi:hypothetical protein